MVALAIVAALAVVAGATVNPWSSGAAVRQEAREIAAAMRRARSVAIASGEAAAFSINLEEKVYRVAERSRALNRTLIYDAVVAERFRGADGEARVVFYPNGAATGAEIRVYAGEHRATVNVNWMTGRVFVDELRKGEG